MTASMMPHSSTEAASIRMASAASGAPVTPMKILILGWGRPASDILRYSSNRMAVASSITSCLPPVHSLQGS